MFLKEHVFPMVGGLDVDSALAQFDAGGYGDMSYDVIATMCGGNKTAEQASTELAAFVSDIIMAVDQTLTVPDGLATLIMNDDGGIMSVCMYFNAVVSPSNGGIDPEIETVTADAHAT